MRQRFRLAAAKVAVLARAGRKVSEHVLAPSSRDDRARRQTGANDAADFKELLARAAREHAVQEVPIVKKKTRGPDAALEAVARGDLSSTAPLSRGERKRMKRQEGAFSLNRANSRSIIKVIAADAQRSSRSSLGGPGQGKGNPGGRARRLGSMGRQPSLRRSIGGRQRSSLKIGGRKSQRSNIAEPRGSSARNKRLSAVEELDDDSLSSEVDSELSSLDSDDDADADSDVTPDEEKYPPWRKSLWYLNWGMDGVGPVEAPDAPSPAIPAVPQQQSSSSSSSGDESTDGDEPLDPETLLRHCEARRDRQDRKRKLKLDECFVSRLVRSALAAKPTGGARRGITSPKVRQLRCSIVRASIRPGAAGTAPRLDLAHRGVGDAASALGEAAARLDPEAVSLRDAGLKDTGAAEALECLLRRSTRLRELDVSENPLGTKTVAALVALGSPGPDDAAPRISPVRPGAPSPPPKPTPRRTLRRLVLERCGLGDAALAKILEVWKDGLTLEHLDVSRNIVGERAAPKLGRIIERGRLVELNLADCKCRAGAAEAIALALGPPAAVKTLDLSWNGFRSADDGPDAFAALADALEHPSSSLTHVDLSHNRLRDVDLKRLGDALTENRTLLGLHLAGESAHVDALGFVMSGVARDAPAGPTASTRPDLKAPPPTGLGPVDTQRSGAGHCFTRILGKTKIPDAKRWARSSCCWICRRPARFLPSFFSLRRDPALGLSASSRRRRVVPAFFAATFEAGPVRSEIPGGGRDRREIPGGAPDRAGVPDAQATAGSSAASFGRPARRITQRLRRTRRFISGRASTAGSRAP